MLVVGSVRFNKLDQVGLNENKEQRLEQYLFTQLGSTNVNKERERDNLEGTKRKGRYAVASD